MTPKKKSDWTPDPFPKPQTYPSGWDGSALMSTNGHQNTHKTTGVETESKDVTDWAPEKFPKPHTFPKNWSIDD
jgi:hypothetical protein